MSETMEEKKKESKMQSETNERRENEKLSMRDWLGFTALYWKAAAALGAAARR
jgi:hypothetical protein